MSKFLSLEWFKQKVDHSIEKVIEKKLDSLINQEEEQKPILNAKLVNDVLTVVLSDHSILTKNDATAEDFNAVNAATSTSQVYAIVSDSNVMEERLEQEKQAQRVQALKQGLSLLKETDEFVVDGNTVYFKGISRSLPQLLVEELIDAVADAKSLNIPLNEHVEYTSLKLFFMWCALNPRAEVAHELYLSLIHISEPTRPILVSRMPSSA